MLSRSNGCRDNHQEWPKLRFARRAPKCAPGRLFGCWDDGPRWLGGGDSDPKPSGILAFWGTSRESRRADPPNTPDTPDGSSEKGSRALLMPGVSGVSGGSLSSRCAPLHRAAFRRHPVLPSTWASPTVARHPRAAGASRRRARKDLRDPPGTACCLRQTPLQVGCESQVSVGMHAATCSNAAAAQQLTAQVVVLHSAVRHDHRGRWHGCTLTLSAQERVLLLHADRLRRARDAEQSRGWPAARRARSWSSTRLAGDGWRAGAMVYLQSTRSALVMR